MTAIQLPGTQEPQRTYTEPEPPENTPPQERAQATAPSSPTDESKQTSTPPAEASQTQEPVQPPKRPLPPDFEDKLARWVKARADWLQKTRTDDMGRIVRAAIADPDAALDVAIDHTTEYLTHERWQGLFQAYLDGGQIPEEWAHLNEKPSHAIDGPAKRQEMLQFQAEAGRAEDPIRAAVRDYIVDPLDNIVPAVAQVSADTYVGLRNWFGAEMKRPDTREWFTVRPKGMSAEEAVARGEASRATAPWPAKVVGGATSMGGQVAGYLVNPLKPIGAAQAVSKGNMLLRAAGATQEVMQAGGKLGAKLGEKFGGKVGATLGKGAGEFGVLGGVHEAAELGRRPDVLETVEGVAIGAGQGAAITAFSGFAKAAFRGMFRHAYERLGKTEQEAMDALKRWGTDNGIFPRAGDTQTGFVNSLTSKWVDAGMPGAPNMAVKKLLGYAVEGGIESAGFSTLDYEFWSKHGEAVLKGDPEALKELGAKLVGGAFALGAFHIPLKDIPAMQRRSQVEPQGEAPKPQEPVPAAETPAAPKPKEPTGGGAETGITRMEGEPEPQQVDPGTLKVPPEPTQRNRATGTVMPAGPEPLAAFGWREVFPKEPPAGGADVPLETPLAPVEGGGIAPGGGKVVELPGTPHSYTVRSEPVPPSWMPPPLARRWARGEVSDVEAVDSLLARYRDPRTQEFDRVEDVLEESPNGQRTIFLPETGTTHNVSTTSHRQALHEARESALEELELARAEGSQEVAEANASLAKALGIKAAIPREQMDALLEHVSLMDALEAKKLPGAEINVDGTHAVGTNGTNDGVMRSYRMGKPMEAPLGPEPQWKPAESVPMRGKDALEPDQQAIVAALKDTLTRAEDLPEGDRKMLAEVTDVLDTVAARNDQSVAETLAALPKLIETMGNAPTPEAASLAIKAAAEMLTTKVPEQAIADMAKADFARAAERVQKRKEQARELSASGESVEFTRKEGEAALAGPDLSKSGRFRLTRLDAEGPIGHTEHETLEQAVSEGLLLGYSPKSKPTTRPSATDLVTLPDGRQFPTYQGETLSWQPGSYFTDADAAKGYPRTKAVLAAMAKYRPEQLEQERREMQRGQFNRMFGRNAKRMLQLIEQAQATAGEPKPESRAGESGSSQSLGIVAPGMEKAMAAGEAVIEGAKSGSTVALKLWDKFQRSQIQKNEDVGNTELAGMARKATTNTKKFRARVDDAALIEMRRLPREDIDSMREQTWDDIGGGTDLYGRVMDEGLAKHFGRVDMESLTPGQRKVAELGREAFLETGRIAEELGVEITNPDGSHPRPFTMDPNRLRLVREDTPEWRQAKLNQSGPLWDAVIDWMQKKYGFTPKEAEAQFSEARDITKLDATEVRRTIETLPIFVRVNGKPARLFESDPLRHTDRMAFTNAQVMGARSVAPRNAPKPVEGGKDFVDEPGLEPLPATFQQIVNTIRNEPNGLQRAKAAAELVRSMHGMQMHPDASIFTPGETGYHVFRVLNGLMGLAKSGALSLSFPMNVAEPLTNVPYFGAGPIGRGYREVARAFVGGRIKEMHLEAIREGAMADSKLNDPWSGDTGIETFENSLKKAGDILTKPLRISQDANQLINYVAAKERLAEMQAGRGNENDRTALKALGFKDAEIAAMLKGEGTPEQYDRYKTNIIGQLAGGSSQVSAERSDVAHSKGFNSLVWFTNFFQGRARLLDTMVRDLAETTGDVARSEKAMQLLKLAGMTMVGGAVGNLFKQFILGNTDEMGNYIREATSGATAGERAANIGEAALGLLASGLVGGLGQPLLTGATSLDDPDLGSKLKEQAIRLIGPLDRGIQFGQFLQSLAGVDVYGYENKSVLGKTAKYLRDAVPAARAVHEGLFGIGALALTEKDPQLDSALDSYYRWRRENKPLPRGGATEEKDREWRHSMRAVMDQVMAGKKWGDEDLIGALTDAVAAKRAQETQGKPFKYTEARDAVAESLNGMKKLPDPKGRGWTKEQIASLNSHLGEKNLQILKDWDATLETMARRVRHANLRR